ncbi:hypothetical protein FA09DRAFT_345885 [Tilletiopsis washingtonensis]|uniref:AB hydrolase-1 domain-containing protein n=1 Tax=Tilletiopsis washingtonensis TaxID=58919 RepID=A0A316ZE57_9BASI|nr:hypothetical protein FA09DRAFT_345885 [Tilletiopsis washingtonensis]PWN98523.1 hypothetical protein FA09DRAFT_345885 [Tilletiopsis washingtonensis]
MAAPSTLTLSLRRFVSLPPSPPPSSHTYHRCSLPHLTRSYACLPSALCAAPAPGALSPTSLLAHALRSGAAGPTRAAMTAASSMLHLSRLSVYLVIHGVWCITPLSWLYLFLTFFRGAPLPLPKPLHAGLAAYCALEAAFSLYHAYLVRQVQQPGPPPVYGRRFLRGVLIRALETGMNDFAPYDDDGHVCAPEADSNNSGNGSVVTPTTASSTGSTGSNMQLRQRLAPVAASSSSSAAGTAAGTSQQLQPPKRPHFLKQHARLRAASVLPSFVFDQPLEEEDVRARRFRDEFALWFQAPRSHITARDAERWLSWALFGVDLEVIEAEASSSSAPSSAGVPLSAPTSAGGLAVWRDAEPIARSGSPMPPPARAFAPSPAPGSDSSARRNKAQLAARARDETTAASTSTTTSLPGEWDPVSESRLDLILYCRELVEARQGCAFPKRAPHWGADVGTDEEGLKSAPKLKSMRLTMDRVRVDGRPLASYLATNALSRLALMGAVRRGFKHEREGRVEYLIWRPKGWSRAKAESGDSRYRPIVFLHGLGIGLAQYANFLYRLTSSPVASTHPILVPLFPHTSQALFHKQFLAPVGHHEMVETLRGIIQHEGWHRVGITIVSHSMGTIVGSWLIKSLGELVRRCCIVDPVCFQLWVPHVIDNFLYGKPKSPVQALMRYFVGRELGTAHALHRHFDWTSNILWPSELGPNLKSAHHVRVYLSEHDAVLNAAANRRYLRSHGMRDLEDGGNIVLAKGAAHGETLMANGPFMDQILEWLATPDPDDEVTN